MKKCCDIDNNEPIIKLESVNKIKIKNGDIKPLDIVDNSSDNYYIGKYIDILA